MNILTKIWRAWTRPVYLAKTVLIIPMAFCSVQATIKLWNLTYKLMSPEVYDFFLAVTTFVVEYGYTIGWVEIGIKVGFIMATNIAERKALSERNRRNTFYVRK